MRQTPSSSWSGSPRHGGLVTLRQIDITARVAVARFPTVRDRVTLRVRLALLKALGQRHGSDGVRGVASASPSVTIVHRRPIRVGKARGVDVRTEPRNTAEQVLRVITLSVDGVNPAWA